MVATTNEKQHVGPLKADCSTTKVDHHSASLVAYIKVTEVIYRNMEPALMDEADVLQQWWHQY